MKDEYYETFPTFKVGDKARYRKTGDIITITNIDPTLWDANGKEIPAVISFRFCGYDCWDEDYNFEVVNQ